MKFIWKMMGCVPGLLLFSAPGWCVPDLGDFERFLGEEGVATAEVLVEKPFRVPVLTVRMNRSEYDDSDLSAENVIGELNVSGLTDGELCFSGEYQTSERELTLGGSRFFYLRSPQTGGVNVYPGYDENNCFDADEKRFQIVSMVLRPEAVPPGVYQIIIKARNRII